MLVSSDCHAGIPTAGYREYLESRYHDDLDDYAASLDAWNESARPFSARVTEARDAIAARDCRFMDSAGRLADLEANGVVAEVIFPGATPGTVPPWSDFLSMGAYRARSPRTRELQWAGERAYNRWLAQLCEGAPGRRVGLAFLPLHDVDTAVAEVRWAADAGLGGVVLPSFNHDVPEYVHGWYWDPIWAACAEAGFSLNFHGGNGLPEWGGHQALVGLEALFFARRAIWHLVFSGAFDRHPTLRVALTEASAQWLPETRATLDETYDAARATLERGAVLFEDAQLPQRRPSEYLDEHCFVGASIVSLMEMERRHEIGVSRMMFGNDYPHPEGTWGRQTTWLQATLGRAGVTEAEARGILGGNAAGLYGLDVDALAPIVERVGPSVEEVLGAVSDDDVEELLAEATDGGRVLAAQHYRSERFRSLRPKAQL